jgi:hypothetical protein
MLLVIGGEAAEVGSAVLDFEHREAARQGVASAAIAGNVERWMSQ